MRNIGTDFENASLAKNRVISSAIKVAWTKSLDDTIDFAEVGVSLVDGLDIVQGELDIITLPDMYEYYDESDHLVQLETDKEVSEPQSSVSYGTGSVILSNFDRKYTPGVDVTIGDYILPKRPTKAFIGFKVNGDYHNIPMIYGTSGSPQLIDNQKHLQLSFFDFISYINDFKLESNSVFIDQTTDEIVEDILNQIGFTAEKYDLDIGFNEISFAYFPKGTSAGAAIRKLCESENAYFYQDELGMIKLLNRSTLLLAPYNAPVMTIDDSQIISVDDLDMSKVINRCVVRGKPREVVNEAEIWKLGGTIRVNGGETIEVFANFKDPVTAVSTITVSATDLNSDLIANTVQDGSGVDHRNDIDIVTTNFISSIKMEITNTIGTDLYITKLRLKGTPAPVKSVIEYIAEDADSQEIYDVNEYVIENDFIDQKEFASVLAKSMVLMYSVPRRKKAIKIRGIPQLQVMDMVTIDIDGDSDLYRILKIENEVTAGSYNQTLQVREVSDSETLNAAIVGVSLVDSEDIVI